MQNKILNLTQHVATPEQKEAGVFEPTNKDRVKDLLTFHELPDTELLRSRAKRLAEIAESEGAKTVMIGGAPYFMPMLVARLKYHEITPLFAFSLRKSIEVQNEDGSVEKANVFRHKGFVEV